MINSESTQGLTWKKRCVFLGLGVLLALAQAPFNISFVYFLVLPFLGWYLREVPLAKIGFGIGWWTGLGYFALTLHWIVEPFLVEPEVTGWMAPFALVGMAGGLALFWGAAFGAAIWLTSPQPKRLLVLAVCWTIAEFLRANILTGFPWGHLSYGLVDLSLIQMTAWFGIHGLGLILLILCFFPAMFAPRIWDGTLWMAVVLMGLNFVGVWREGGVSEPNPSGTIVRIVQPNAAQHLKWQPDMVGVFLGRQLGYTAARTEPRPDVVIWPETAIPYRLNDSLPLLQEIADAAGSQTSVVAGIVRQENEASRNALLYLDPLGGLNAVYDKQHLVPFGEYMPFVDVFDRLGLSRLTGLAGRFQAGRGSRVISGRNVPDFLALICYEAIFPQHAQSDAKRPEWIVHITNDAWFGQFSGPYQHLAQARVRAIEQGLPLVRSANTGVSAVIDSRGRVVQSLPLGKAGYFDQRLPAASQPTLYGRAGEWVWIILVGIIGFVSVLAGSRNRRVDAI